jgi:hypothetical protein
VGAPYGYVVGRFRAPVYRGRNVLLTYSYPWFGRATQIATETDTDSARTLLTESGRVSVARGPASGRPAFKFKFSYGYPRHASAPRINRCKA